MKTIKIRNADTKKVMYQFIVTDTQLKLAEKLGINEQDYLVELSKTMLKEKESNEPNND